MDRIPWNPLHKFQKQTSYISCHYYVCPYCYYFSLLFSDSDCSFYQRYTKQGANSCGLPPQQLATHLHPIGSQWKTQYTKDENQINQQIMGEATRHVSFFKMRKRQMSLNIAQINPAVLMSLSKRDNVYKTWRGWEPKGIRKGQHH